MIELAFRALDLNYLEILVKINRNLKKKKVLSSSLPYLYDLTEP